MKSLPAASSSHVHLRGAVAMDQLPLPIKFSLPEKIFQKYKIWG